MSRWLWIFAAVLISTLVYFTLRFGLRPKPIPVMSPTEFEDLQQVGAVVYKRLRQNVRSERLVVLGSDTEVAEYAGIWTGFLKTALSDENKIVALFQREGLQPIESGGIEETIPFNDEMIKSGELQKAVSARLKPKNLVIIHGLTNESSHLVGSSLSRQLEKGSRHPILSISSLPLPLDVAAADDLQTSCLDPSREEGSDRLSCVSRRIGRQYFKKKLAHDKTWAAMERYGLKEYLVFIHTK